MANTQLTRIVAPNINEVDYAEKMQSVFNNINENFAKIASLPFIQGVQGDSYQLVEKPIWQKNGADINDAKLTEDGAVLLGSIFNKHLSGNYESLSKDLTFKDVKKGGKTNKYLKDLTIRINGKDVNPIDFYYIDENGDIANNILYFYAVINDSGKEEEKQLGQYYYFIDARLKFLGDLYYGTDKSILSSFTDYTGFYQYKPASKTEDERYDKISILPSLYYDQYKNDICWKFNGNESGVSAIGVKGMDGKDSSFQIVHVTLNENQTISNTTSGEVDGVYRFNTLNTTTTWEKDTTEISSKVAEGNAIISIEYSKKTTSKEDPDKESIYIAYGQIKFEENNGNKTAYAYWNRDTVLDKVMNYSKINSYFYNMRPGSSIPVNAPKHIAVPAVTNSETNSGSTDIPAHTISNDINNSAALKFQYTKQGFTGPDSSQVELPSYSGSADHKAIFENYNVEIKKGDLDIPKGKIRIGTTDGLGTITKTGSVVGINYTPVVTGGTSCAIQLNVGGTTYDSAIASIDVRGSRHSIGYPIGTVTVKPKLKVDGSLTVTNTASLSGGAEVSGNILFKNTGNIKVEPVKQITGGGCPSGAGHFWRGKENAFILHDGYNSDDIFYPVVTVKATNNGAYYSMGAWMDNFILEYIPEAVHDKIKKPDTVKNNLVKSIKFNHDSTGINLEVSGKATINNGAIINNGATINGNLDVIGSIRLNPYSKGFYTERKPNTDEGGVDKVRTILGSGMIYGTDKNIGWTISPSVPDGTLIICTGGNVGKWNKGPDYDENDGKKQNYFSFGNGWKAFGGGLFIVLSENRKKKLYCVASSYYGQGFIG